MYPRLHFQGHSGTPEPYHPFELYLYQSPNKIRIHSGTVNNIHPNNDDSQASPLEITIPNGSSLYKVWLAITLNVTTGAVTNMLIRHGLDGWQTSDSALTDYPTQPTTTTANENPAGLYVLLGEVSYDAPTFTIYQNILTSLYAIRIIDSFGCGDGWVTLYKMAVWRT